MTDFTTFATVIGSLGAGAIAITAGASWIVRRLHKFTNRFDEFMEDWNGAEARPGVRRRPGVMERMSDQDAALKSIDDRLISVEAEINPSGGKSIKDAVSRMDGNIRLVKEGVNGLNTRVTRLEQKGGGRRPTT